ncbi:TetR/AcrR family transcriptional regulator [Streptomyces xiaopingdaonensis]|uniref:TetR/AcrR family transcriptional regulator n=1 Tax=Streptomyces xiaopingdaonensis TaxID=1565415 RepID=UPI0003710231|nr:TetR family transcriptional regulator [Streptomyces xiaopingdaonensis]
MTVTRAHRDRAGRTREALMVAAERLYAEHGLLAVSNRRIGEAVGQRNVTAVGYHFGSRTELVRAIMARHGEQVDGLRGRCLAGGPPGDDVRGWVECLARPPLRYLASLGVPSWSARFSAQVMTEPALGKLVGEEACARPHLRRILDGLGRRLDHLPPPVRESRGTMARQLVTAVGAERERALAEGGPRESWEEASQGLVDALVGLLTAEVTEPARTIRNPRQGDIRP